VTYPLPCPEGSRTIAAVADNAGLVTRKTANVRTVTVTHGVVRIDQRIRVAQAEVGTDASGPACIFARVHVRKGRLAYLQGRARIAVPKRFAIFLPPFTVVQAALERCDVSTVGVAFRPPPAPGLPSAPVLIPFDEAPVPATPEEVIRLVREAHDTVDIGRTSNPLPLAMHAKSIVDSEYGASLTIAAVARRLRTSSAVLSRSFRQTYGIPPIRYRHHVRIMDALLRLADGELPIAVSQDVGFEDLSRFYKILRQVACAPPGIYRPHRSRNAKT
jgi:AraC-like DNA-binding protein